MVLITVISLVVKELFEDITLELLFVNKFNFITAAFVLVVVIVVAKPARFVICIVVSCVFVLPEKSSLIDKGKFVPEIILNDG